MLIYWQDGKENRITGATSYLMAVIDNFSASWDSWRLYTNSGSLLATKG